MQKDYQIEIDHLALGLTRAPMFLGINLKYFFIITILCLLVCIDLHTILGLPLFGFLYILALKFSAKEPNFFILWMKWFTKTPPVLNSWFWGGVNSYESW